MSFIAAQSAQRTTDNSPVIHRWEDSKYESKSVKRTTDKAVSYICYSAVRFPDYISFATYPGSELLGYYQSSATRTG